MDLTNNISSTLKTAALNFINPFTSDEKMVSVIAAIASKFILNFSFKYSCLIGFLTFGSLKIYQLGKKQQSDIFKNLPNNYNIIFTPASFPMSPTGTPTTSTSTPTPQIKKSDKATGRNDINDNGN